jgi:hypothetical protein
MKTKAMEDLKETHSEEKNSIRNTIKNKRVIIFSHTFYVQQQYFFKISWQ